METRGGGGGWDGGGRGGGGDAGVRGGGERGEGRRRGEDKVGGGLLNSWAALMGFLFD